MRWFLRSKIHKATVTKTNLDYVDSIGIDESKSYRGLSSVKPSVKFSQGVEFYNRCRKIQQTYGDPTSVKLYGKNYFQKN